MARLKKMSALVIMIIPFWICDEFGGAGAGASPLNAREPPRCPHRLALRSDVVRRATSRGGTLRCAEARRVAYRDVDKSYASHRLS